jgi:hypothetical protein
MFWCCCGAAAPSEISIDFNGMDYSFQWEWWTPGDGERDPIIGRLPVGPFFASGTSYRRPGSLRIGRSALLGGIPIETYSNVTLEVVGYAATSDGTTADTVDYPSDFDIYCWENGLASGDFSDRFVSGIARSELLGPVVWDASGEDWIGSALRTTPNLASIVNPVINGPGWDENSLLHLVFDVAAQQAATTPPGRTLSMTVGNTLTLQW